MVLVTGDRPEQAKQVLERWLIDADVVTDPRGEIAKKLNAFFTPRAYIFEDGRLIYKQDRFRVKPQEWLWEAMRQ
jgi:hypothetical protein